MSTVHGAYAAPNWANSQRVGDVGTKATLMLLAAYADENFSCFPGQERIADETEQSVRTVRRQLDVLEEVGLIEREPRYVFSEASGKRVRTSDRFRLHLDVKVTKADVQAALERIAAGERTKKTTRTKPDPGPLDLPAKLAGRSDEDLAARLAGRSEQVLPANLAGRSDEDLAARLAGRSEQGPTGQNERTYRPESGSTPDTSDRVTPRRTPKKINTYVTSTSVRDVTGPVDNSDLDQPAVRSGVELTTGDAVADVTGAQVDGDEVERTLVLLPDRLRPTAADVPRLRNLIEQRMRRGWTREAILEAVDRRLRPGALDNPCGLFAKTLVPLDEAPSRQPVLSLVPAVVEEAPWCGECDKRTRRPIDSHGFPDFTLPLCTDCAQLSFASHMERGAS